MKQELVQDWMTRDNIVTTSPSTPVAVARKLMKENKIHRLPVVEDDRLVGIITLRELHEATVEEMNTLSIWDLHELLASLYVRGEMTPNPVTIRPGETIGRAARLMAEHNISGLPVVDDTGKVVGIITESDIFRAVTKQWGE